MDASKMASISPFRYRTNRRRRILLAIVLILLAAKTWFHGRADANPALVQSGSYQLSNINSDGSLKLLVPLSKPVEIDVGWLAIEITNPVEAVRWMKSTIGESNRVQVRLDRRRVNEHGQLMAYFLKDDLVLNAEMVRLGFATEDTHPADFAPIARQIRQAQGRPRPSLTSAK